METSIAVIVTAAGSSSRMGGIKKEYCRLPEQKKTLSGLTVLGAAVSAFRGFPHIHRLVITVPAEERGGEQTARACLPPEFLEASAHPTIRFVAGGKTRRASVHCGLSLLASDNPGFVLIHDGARPWVSRLLIERLIDAVQKHRAVLPLLPLTDTPKEVDDSGFVARHLKRNRVAAAQTPQAFAFPAILEAHERAAERERLSGVEYTDDAEIWSEFFGPVAFISGEPENRKITFPEDLS
ncbi:MAG: 2-C-methyl-D-erythritol 4-phosphate cytidylyltransferase [Treponema sp.]|jgi:2-C-methyl-D-erythritol 4-phosphate cytidylyltransferase/2-C-methyl-D-erythritol 4-phosphate cytidylyltransferase/2-C-methyl-D-erythritol 2,4-cyclodiphosphate synthase|nr:2-C-methyl-D-erythritol 4-phosphate cytidylyltransferase [Treponema sp.]